ncbi:MAG: iron(III) ABC transporter ATP-binding protein [Betaproteobacteria bacterium]|nr:MAG: iron(III) ABC transporter ATP-binding protein [Betaproteobacteria bacterium]
MNDALCAERLAFGYAGHPVGRDVSLALRPGEVVALLGPNGGGKTTLFRTLLGLLPARSGRVLLGGTDLRELDRRAIARRVAYVPQAHTGYFPFEVLDVVTMGRTAHLPAFASPGARDREAARAALARVGMSRLEGAAVTRISGGERQLVLIARALAQEAPLIVMDEPTASLDFGNQVRVLDEIRRLRGGGAGVLLSTHHPDHALQLADRVALLHGGRLIADAPPREAITPARLREVYGVDVAVREVVDAAGATHLTCVPASGKGGAPAW